MGGDITFGGVEHPLPPNQAGTDMAGASERVAHIADCLPEICTLDCGTMNFAESDYVMTNTPGMLQAMGRMMTNLGVKPEIEAFDTGHLWCAKQLVADGVLAPDALVQLCMGVPWGAPDDMGTFMAMVNNVPDGWTFSAFGLGRHQMPYVAASVLAGGHVRVGLEDNLMLDRGVPATNAQLVERAAEIIERLGARVLGPDEVRDKLGLTKRAPGSSSSSSNSTAGKKVCPECGHVFKGNGWDGIDAHWRSKHEDIMPYEDAWPLLQRNRYRKASAT
jgi:uncharacterized protein (DUF849 family)